MPSTSKSVEIVHAPQGEMQPSKTLNKFIVNIGYGGIRGSVLFANTLVLTPILISRLGREQFAILALATPFLRYGFNGVFDMGLATALVRFVSRDFASGDYRSINKYFASAFLLYIVSGIVLLSLYSLVSPLILRSLLGINMRLYLTARTALWQLLCTYVLFLLSNPFFAVLMGAQKVHLSHVVGTMALIIELIGVLLLLPFGITISRIVVVYVASATFSTLLCLILARRHYPHLRLEPVSQQSIFELLHYTARWSVTVSTSLLPPVIDKLILVRYVGLSYVAIYEAAAKLVEVMKRATQLFLLPLFPLAGAVVATQTEEQAQAFYRQIFGANLAINAGLYLIPTTLTFGIMRIWLGPELSRPAGWAFLILSITGFLLALVTPAALILAGTARMRLLVRTGLLALFLNLSLSAILAKHLGFPGILAGTLFAYGGQSLLILTSLQRRKEFALHVGRVLFIGLIAVGSGVIPGLLLVTISDQESTAAKWASLAVIDIVIYCVALLAFEENRKLASSVAMQGRNIFLS